SSYTTVAPTTSMRLQPKTEHRCLPSLDEQERLAHTEVNVRDDSPLAGEVLSDVEWGSRTSIQTTLMRILKNFSILRIQKITTLTKINKDGVIVSCSLSGTNIFTHLEDKLESGVKAFQGTTACTTKRIAYASGISED
ncbi:hypothetical protein BGZ65_000033, partial [Modicella reniformis]